MTTILADFRLGLMVADSGISDGDRQWRGRKVWRIGEELVGMAGHLDEMHEFISWYRGEVRERVPKMTHTSALVLSKAGLMHYGLSTTPYPVESGREAIGSGAKAAMCAYEALAWKDPMRAVQIVCRHDAGSRAPVRVYKLKSNERPT